MPDETNLTAAPETFKTAYCRRFGCAPGAFERRLFWRCLPLRAWPAALFFKMFYPSFFNADLEFLQGVGACRSSSQAVNEANSLGCDPALNEGLLRTPLGLRLSGRRLVRAAHEIWPPLARPTWTPAAADPETARFVAPTPKVPQAPKSARSNPPSAPPATPLAAKLAPRDGQLQAGPSRKRSPYSPTGARSRKG